MTGDDLFETETMAELCARQGRNQDALLIYQRLIETAPRASGHARWVARVDEIMRSLPKAPVAEIGLCDVAMPDAPGLNLVTHEDGAQVAWALPDNTVGPTLELLLIHRGPSGVELQKQQIVLDQPTGRMSFTAPGLIRALGAVGRQDGSEFVPLARAGS